MFLKKIPIWLRYGVYFSIGLTLLSYILSFTVDLKGWGALATILVVSVIYFYYWIIGGGKVVDILGAERAIYYVTSPLWILISSLVVYFILGVIIGLIVGKIKSMGKKHESGKTNV